MRYSEIKIGQEASITVEVVKEDVKRFFLITDDTNSIHQGKRGVVFGMLTASYISALIGKYLPGDGAVISRSTINFFKPVFIGDELTIVGRVTRKTDAFHQIEVDVEVTNQNSEQVISSTYLVSVRI